MAELIVPNNMASSEVGVPSKGGALKVYYNANNYRQSIRTIDNAIRLHKYFFEEYQKIHEVK